MHRAIVFANGSMDKPQKLISTISSSDMIIAADGGIQNCTSLGIQPHLIIGDLDSMEPDEVALHRNAGVAVIQYPTQKDETDLELALRFVLQREVSEVIILGGLGARWDMTISNLLLIAHPMFSGLKIRFLDGNQELFLLRAGERLDIHGNPGDMISLIPLAGEVSGIDTNGLEYPLRDETLKFGSSRGVSNVFTQDHAHIDIREGLLLCVLTRGQ